MAKKITRRQFTADFKRDAVARLEAGTISRLSLAKELSVGKNMLDRWRRLLGTRGTAEMRIRGNPATTVVPPTPSSLSSAAAGQDPTLTELYALVGRLLVENQMLRRRLGEG